MTPEPTRPTSLRCLLLDFLDHSLDTFEDACERHRALAAAGADPRLVAVRDEPPGGEEAPAPPRNVRTATGADWTRVLRESAPGVEPGVLLVCGGEHDHRSDRAAELWDGPVRAWPTRLTGGPTDLDALEGAVAARQRGARVRTSLWDGDYLLAPSSLEGPDGEALLEAFSVVAEEHDMLDLVVLGQVPAELRNHARSLGIGLRVHGVGAAPLRAESTWLACAAAVLLGAGPLPGTATLLRALEGPAPLRVLGDAPATRTLHGWLVRHGATCGVPAPGPAAGIEALRETLARGPEVRAAVVRGAALASALDGARAAASLGLAWPGARRAAA